MGALAAGRVARKARIFALTKGFRGKRKNCFSIAVRAAERAMQNAYIGRKEKKRTMRQMWIGRVSSAAAENDITYSVLMHDMATADVQINRKVLAEIAMHEPKSFSALTKFSKEKAAEVRLGFAALML